MLRNYIKISIRNLRRHPGYSLINVVGLAIGMAACILILLYIRDELSYDRQHEYADRIYRLVDEQTSGGQTVFTAGTPPAWAPALKRDYPEVLEYVRMRGTGTAWLIEHGDKRFYEKRVIWAESSLFDVFTIPLAAGDPRNALTEPYSMLISEETATKYFGDDDALDKIIRVDNRWDFTVTGVMRNMPSNSHIHPAMFASYSSLDAIGDTDTEDWEDHWNSYIYLLLRKGASPERLTQQLPAFLDRYAGDKFREAGVTLNPIRFS